MADRTSEASLLTEQRVCPGCKLPVVTENGGVVVAFGQSFFHIDCFRCAKCNNQVTADTNLLLLSDGSPVCADCSYCCNVCGQPILDEAIMTGEDSYHAHCFNCKVCKKRIDELVFAKTSQGIYCMPCHSERVAKSRRHQERREREKREREKRAAAAATGNTVASIDGNSARISDSSNRAGNHGTSPPATTSSEPSAAPTSARSASSYSQGRSTTPRSAEFTPSSSTMQRGASSSSQVPTSTTSSAAPSPTVMSSNKRFSNLMPGRPASPSVNRDSPDHVRSTSTPLSNLENLSAATNDGTPRTVQKMKSYDDRPLNALTQQQNTDPMAIPPTGLLAIETSRKEKRRSINPGLVMSFNLPPEQLQNNPFAATPSTPVPPHIETRPRSPSLQRAHSPARDDRPREVAASSPITREIDNNKTYISNSSRLQLETSPAFSQDRPTYGRSRSASSTEQTTSTPEAAQMRSKSPMRLSITLDRVPTRSSSRPEHRQDSLPVDGGRRTPQFSAEGRSSPNLNVPSGSPMSWQRSLDGRHRSSTSSLGQNIEVPPRTPNASRPTSPAHRVDVPHSIESGTDTEGETEESFITENSSIRDSLPPLPPPKETKGVKAGTRPPQLKLDAVHVEDDERLDISQIEPEEFSEEFAPEEHSVESTSRSTYIAPALPPIRFSMVGIDIGTDFSDILKSMAGQETNKKSVEIAGDGKGTPADKRPQTHSPAPPQTPTNEQSTFAVDDSTPVQRREPRTQSPALPTINLPKSRVDEGPKKLENGRPAAEPSMLRSISSPEPRDPIAMRMPTGPIMRRRERHGSDASLAPANGFLEPVHELAPSPEITKGTVRPEFSEIVIRRLQEALQDTRDRGAAHVKLDTELIEAILSLLHQRQEECNEMKQKLDGVKRTSQQYIEGLTVAQTEYDKELKARREAEAEVARLRVLLTGQQARLAAASGETMKQEAQKQLSQERSQDMSNLERSLSKLKLERDMTLAEVEELSASKSSTSMVDDAEGAARLSRALSVRFDNIKNQYQGQLLPLTNQKEALFREIAEMKAMRDAVLAETAALSARNEALAQLNSQYGHRADVASSESSHETDRRDASFDRTRQMTPSVNSSNTAYSDESSIVKVSKADVAEAPTPHMPRTKILKWPGTRTQALAAGSRDNALSWAEVSKPKPRVEHNFQQVSTLRVTRCDHCGDKMWTSLLRCTNCSCAVHTRCMPLVHLPCSQQNSREDVGASLPLAPVGPSMFGRDLTEQVRADGRDNERLVPIIVEKCIEAVDALALDYEGIYRKTGGSGQSKTITQLFERGDYAAFDLRDTDRFNDICSVTSVLKNYFRSLPVPLLTYDLHNNFIDASSIKDLEAKNSVLTELVSRLPREHYDTCRVLLQHLHRVAEHSDQNLMHARNLGVVFGPTLMRSRDPAAEFSDMAGKALTVEWLVENAPSIFPPLGSPTS